MHRQIQDHWLWKDDEPFDQRSAWIDLLLLAYHEDTKRVWRGELKVYKRGTVNVSIAFLAERWKWSWRRVKRFLRMLEKDGMITQSVTTRNTAIFLTNYDVFQGERRTNVRTDVTSNVRTDVTQSIMINNDNNVDKAPDGAHITETEDEDEIREAPKPQYRANPDRVAELMAKARERLFNGNT